MSLYDYVRADGRLKCEKCGRILDCQTKATMCQYNTLTINEIAAYLAIFADGDGAVLSGYCEHCRHCTYYEIEPVTVKRINDPYEEDKETKKLPDQVGLEGRVIAVGEAEEVLTKDKSTNGGTR